MSLIDAIAGLAVQRCLTALEPPPLGRIAVRNSANTGAITTALQRMPHDSLHRFARSKSRSAVLSACRNYLGAIDDHEQLVVALGREHGTGARFDGVWIGHGRRSEVGFTPLALETISNQLRVDGAEILVAHNHPANDIKTLLRVAFGWRPLPSSGDRETAFAHSARAWRAFANSGSWARFRWYLVDEGEIAEFFLPSAERILAMLQGLAAVGKVSSATRSA